MSEIKVKVVGYGAKYDNPSYDATLYEVTKNTIWLKTEFGKQGFRRRDGKKIGDSLYRGYKISDAALKRINEMK